MALNINNYKIMQWNCQGISNNYADLINLIHDENPDIILLNETWLKPDRNFKIKNYHIERLDRVDGVRGGGIATLIKNASLCQKIKLNLNGLPVKLEVSAIKLENITIINMYCSPDTSLTIRFLQQILNQVFPPFILMGDLNGHHPVWGSDISNESGRNILEIVQQENLVILNDGSETRIHHPHQNKSCIDITIVTPDLANKIFWSVLQKPTHSDHLPTSCVLQRETHHQVLNSPLFKWKIRKANWEEYYSNFNINQNIIMYNDFVETINQAANNAIPQTKDSDKTKKITPKPIWWNQQCEQAAQERNQAFRQFKINFSEQNYLNYKIMAAKARRTAKQNKKQSFKHFCESLNKDTPISKVWKVIQKFSNNFSYRQVLTENDDWLVQFLDSITPPYIPAEEPQVEQDNQDVEEITIDELQYILNLKKDSTPGIDNITYSMLKYSPMFIKDHLRTIFNKVLTQEYNIPEDWKSQIIIPILKPNKDPSIYSSYRPIALASCIGKTFESIIKMRLEYHLENKFFFNDFQMGFRKGKGINECLTTLATDIYSSFSKNNMVIGVFIDLKSAYDMVSLDILKKKLKQNNINSKVIDCIINLMKSRNIYVRSPKTGKLTGPKQAHIGLPQGSPLSPLLFNIFTQDLKNVIGNNVKLLQYADDLVIYFSGQNLEYMIQKTQETLDHLADWSVANEMLISTEKTKSILFSKGFRNFPPITFNIQGSRIEWVRSLRYLGMIFEYNLSWKLHIENCCVKANKAINVMKSVTRTWWGAHQNTLLIIYKGLVRPHLDFGCQAISFTSKYNCLKLDRVQYQALRVVLGCMRSTPTNALLAEAGELPLNLRRIYLCTKFAFKKLAINDDITSKSIMNFYAIFNQEPRYWRNKPTPAILEGWDSALSQINLLEKSNRFPCWGFSYDSQIKNITLVNSKIQKHSPSAHLELEDLINKSFKDYEIIFTDASLEPESQNCGVGIFNRTKNISITGKCINGTSICAAEILAIRIAIETIQNNPEKILIISDSMSAIQKICRQGFNHTTDINTLKTRENISKLKNEDKKIQLLWIPSHSNILGNERADQLAAQARNTNNLVNNNLHYLNLLSQEKDNIWKEWIRVYKHISQQKGAYYYSLVDSPSQKPWFAQNTNLTRGKISLLCRMRTGHILSPKHLFKIGINDNENCECGQVGDLTHILFSCNNRTQQCQQLYNNLAKIIPTPISIPDILRNPSGKASLILIKYLEENNIKL